MAWTDADFYAGDGSISSPFVIHDKPNGYTAVEQFMNGIGDSNYVGKGYYFQLGQDLDFDGITVKCVGSSSVPFVGTIDGNGYTIKNIHKTMKYDGGCVLIYGNAGAIVRSCKFTGTVITSTDGSSWSGFMRAEVVERCIFDHTVINGDYESYATCAIIYTSSTVKGKIADCVFSQNQENTDPYSHTALTYTTSHNVVYHNRLLISGAYKRYIFIGTYVSSSAPYNQFNDIMQIGVAVYDDTIESHTCGRITNFDPSYQQFLDIHNCYAREDCTVGGSVPTQYCTKTGINGENVSADVYQQKGFWDGTGVDGTVYLDWDFENVWDWDDVNRKPVLRMQHAPIPSLVTGVWVKTENGWRQSTDLSYMR